MSNPKATQLKAMMAKAEQEQMEQAMKMEAIARVEAAVVGVVQPLLPNPNDQMTLCLRLITGLAVVHGSPVDELKAAIGRAYAVALERHHRLELQEKAAEPAAEKSLLVTEH